MFKGNDDPQIIIIQIILKILSLLGQNCPKVELSGHLPSIVDYYWNEEYKNYDEDTIDWIVPSKFIFLNLNPKMMVWEGESIRR